MQLYELGLTSRISQVPVIALFTKFDQFRRNVRMRLEDEGGGPEMDLYAKMERVFEHHYVAPLGEHVPFIRLEREGSIHQMRQITLISVIQEYTSMANRLPILLT